MVTIPKRGKIKDLMEDIEDALNAGGGGGGGSSSWGSITGTLSSQTDLQSALDGKQASGSYAASSHGHSISDVSGLQTALDGKQAAGSYASATHSHAISDTTGLQTALDAKAPLASPTFTGTVTLPAGQVVNGVTLTTGGGTSDFLRADGTYAAPAGGGGGLTAQTVAMTSTQASSSNVQTDITQLVLPVAANSVYLITCFVTFQSAATTTGLVLGIATPASAINQVEIVVPITSTAVASQLRTIFPNAAVPTNQGTVIGTGVTGTNSNHTARIIGQIITGATAGNVQIRFASEINASAITLQIGSRLTLVKIA